MPTGSCRSANRRKIREVRIAVLITLLQVQLLAPMALFFLDN